MAACTPFLSLFCLLLILILSGDIELNPCPEDVVKCVCESREDSGHMIACDSCSCWSHSSCVNITPTVADKYSFLCSSCIKSSFLSISTLCSEISLLKAHVIKLEKICRSLTSSSTESIKVSNTLDSLSTKVQSTVHCLPTSVPSSSITSNTADNPTPL